MRRKKRQPIFLIVFLCLDKICLFYFILFFGGLLSASILAFCKFLGFSPFFQYNSIFEVKNNNNAHYSVI